MMKLIDRLLELDSGLLLYLNNLGTPSWDAFWFAVSHKLTFVPLYVFLLFLMIPWSVMVGYSRIYVGKHYPLDVICGLIFGLCSGYLFYNLFKALERRFVLS